MSKPRAFTAEEVRAKFLKQVKGIATYWCNESRAVTAKEKCDGVAFSILVLLDGENGSFPGVDLRIAPHPDDKLFNIGRGENWYKPNQLINDVSLHDEFTQLEAK